MGPIAKKLKGNPFARIIINPNYPFRNNDIVTYTEYDGEEELQRYCLINYDDELAAFILYYFKDATCKKFIFESDEAKIIKVDMLGDIGLENIALFESKDE